MMGKKISGNKKMFRRLLRWIVWPKQTSRLHRWCHKQSDVYKEVCNVERKIDAANLDNSFDFRGLVKRSHWERL